MRIADMEDPFHHFAQRVAALADESSRLVQSQTDIDAEIGRHEHEIEKLKAERDGVDTRISALKEQKTMLMGNHNAVTEHVVRMGTVSRLSAPLSKMQLANITLPASSHRAPVDRMLGSAYLTIA